MSNGNPLGWAEVERSLARTMDGYQPRVSQQQLAEFMRDSLVAGVPAFCEAPTGTGKSAPLLVTLIDHALATGQVTLAATATKALQDQYLADLKYLKEDVYDGGFEYAVLKGRSNYVCKIRAAQADEVGLGIVIDDVLREAEDVNGDLDRLPMQISPKARQALSMSANECPGKANCKIGEKCFAERAKKTASEADVVVVNHAMIAIDAVLMTKVGFGMLPPYQVVGVDEAHELESYVSNALTTEVSQRSIDLLISDVCTWLDEMDRIKDGGAMVAKLFAKLRGMLTGLPRGEKSLVISPAMAVELGDVLNVVRFLSELAAMAQRKRAASDDESVKKARLRCRLDNAVSNLNSVLTADFSDVVRWLELDEYVERGAKRGRGVLVCQAPLSVGTFMANALWSRCVPLLVSATLAVDKDFSYMASEIGLDLIDKPYRSFQCATPFDYGVQARTYIAGDLPNPRQSKSGHRAGVNHAITELVEAAQGRALCLFTSREGLDASYNACAPQIEQMGYRVLRQGEMPTRQLAELFKKDKHSVLFATKSFFTGVDVQGESLSLLVLDKLPFHVPTVVWKARQAALDESVSHLSRWEAFTKGSFTRMSLPDMVITLLQGYGRLIRSVTDKGLVAILDPAVAPGGPKYGAKVRAALPPAPIVFTLAEAVAFARTLPVTPDLDAMADLTDSLDDLIETVQ